MATNRTPIGRPPIAQITPAAIEFYRAFVNADTDDERNIARRGLYLELKRKPWQATITGTIGYRNDEAAPDYIRDAGPDKLEEWRDARAIRIQLDAAMELG